MANIIERSENVRKNEMSRFPFFMWNSMGRTNPICIALIPEAGEPEARVLNITIQRPVDSNAAVKAI